MHRIDTVIGQLGEQTIDAIGPTAATVFAANGIVLAVAPGAELLNVLVTAGVLYLLDPGGVDGYLFRVEEGSPLIGTIIFPFLLGSEVRFRLEMFDSGRWMPLGIFNELDIYSFGDGASNIRFFLLDYDTGWPLSNVEEFTIGLTFVRDGLVNGEFSSFSSVPGPSTLLLILTGLGAGFLSRRGWLSPRLVTNSVAAVAWFRRAGLGADGEEGTQRGSFHTCAVLPSGPPGQIQCYGTTRPTGPGREPSDASALYRMTTSPGQNSGSCDECAVSWPL
jgi:hypothetical protein